MFYLGVIFVLFSYFKIGELHFMRDLGQLEKIWRRAIRKLWDLENATYEERLEENLVCLAKRKEAWVTW